MENCVEISEDESVVCEKSKPFTCTYENCKVSFTKRRKLINHIRSRHTGERPFVCDEQNCTKSYTNSSHLRRHKKVYHEKSSNERVTCSIEDCQKEFANKWCLKKHHDRFHNPSREYRFVCVECKQGFPRKRLLRAHTFLHSELPFRISKDENKKKEWLQSDKINDSTKTCSLEYKPTDSARVIKEEQQHIKCSAVPNSLKEEKFIVESSVHNEQKTCFETIYIVTKDDESNEIKVKIENGTNSEDEQDILANTNSIVTPRRMSRSKIKAENEEEFPLKNVRRLAGINIDKVSGSSEDSKLCLEVAIDIIKDLKMKIKSVLIGKNKLKEKLLNLNSIKKRSREEEMISDKTDDNSHVRSETKFENLCKDKLGNSRNSSPEIKDDDISSTTIERFFDECEDDEEPPLKIPRLDNINIDEITKSSEESKLYLEIALSTVKELRTKVKCLQSEKCRLYRYILKEKMQM